MKQSLILVAGLWLAASAHADMHGQILNTLAARAGAPSASRGEKLFRGRFTGGRSAESCTDCHTADPRAAGQHVKTHKAIDPLAPVANRERFTDLAKVEKWFRRNCPDVLGRNCTHQEMADFAAYMLSVK